MSLGAASWGGRPLGGSGRASLTLRSGPGAGVADPGPPSGSGWEAPSSSGSPVGWTNVDEPRLKGEGGQASACLSASVKMHFFGPKMIFFLTDKIQGGENMVSRKNARQGASKNGRGKCRPRQAVLKVCKIFENF